MSLQEETMTAEDLEWLKVAERVKAKAKCLRTQVGAVLVAEDGQLYVGYNGTPADQVDCTDGGCPRGQLDPAAHPTGGKMVQVATHPCHAIHAEEAAIASAGPEQASGATMYVTRVPCDPCESKIAQAGIQRVVHLP